MSSLLRRAACSLSRPARLPNALAVVLLGGGVSLVPLVGAAWALGYALEYARAVAREGPDAPLPDWIGWRRLFLDGVAGWLVATLYQLPGWLFVAAAVPFLAVQSLEIAGWITPGLVAPLTGPVLLALATPVLLLGLWLTPAALLAFLRTGRWQSGFSRPQVQLILHRRAGSYARLVSVCGWQVLGLLGLAITPPGLLVVLILGSWVFFYFTLVWARLWGRWAAENRLWPAGSAAILDGHGLDGGAASNG